MSVLYKFEIFQQCRRFRIFCFYRSKINGQSKRNPQWNRYSNHNDPSGDKLMIILLFHQLCNFLHLLTDLDVLRAHLVTPMAASAGI